jgi:integrase
MRLFKRRGVYYCEILRDQRRSLKTSDIEEAKRRMKKIEKTILKDRLYFIEREHSITVAEFFSEYDAWLEKSGAEHTWKRVHRILPKFKDAVGAQKQLHELDYRSMDAFVNYCRQRKNSPVTINLEIRSLKAALSWARERNYIKANPFSGYKQLRVQQKEPAFLTIEEIRKMFEIIGTNRKYRMIFALYVYTGARREEIHRLEWKDIKVDGIHIRKTKNARPRIVPISVNLQMVLDEYYKGVGRLFKVGLDQMGRRMKHYLRKSGLGHMRPHDLRHTFASQLIMAGVDMKTVGELLGHTSYAATQIYAHLLQEHKVQAIGKLPY